MPAGKSRTENVNRTTTEDSQVSSQTPDSPASAAAPRDGQAVLTLKDSDMESRYANFFRVTATPEEVVLDFGMDMQPYSRNSRSVAIDQRVVMNYFTAKRLLTALASATQQHEKTFGAVELDPSRRKGKIE